MAQLIDDSKKDGSEVYKKMASYEEAKGELRGAGGVPSYIPEG